MSRKRVLVFCLGIKSAIHFSLYDRALLESEFDIDYLVVTSPRKFKNYQASVPSQFTQVESVWDPDSQTTFYTMLLCFRFFFAKGQRKHFSQWLRYFLFGNQNSIGNFRSFLIKLFRVAVFLFNHMSSLPLFWYSIIRFGSFPSKCVRVPVEDREQFFAVLDKACPEFVIIQTTLCDLSTFNLINLLKQKNIASLVLVDSWDNIGSKPMIPKDIEKLLVQSPQQRSLALEVYGLQDSQISLFGTPRISRIRNVKSLRKHKVLNVGYLQAMPADDLEFNIGIIHQLLNKLLLELRTYDDFTIVIRAYPIKSFEKRMLIDGLLTSKFGNRVKIQSKFESMETLLSDSDLIVSEVTTAGIEAACEGLRTVFIATDSNRTYLNGRRALNSLHAHDLRDRGFRILEGKNVEVDYVSLKEVFQQYSMPNVEYFAFVSSYDTISERLIGEVETQLFSK